MPGVFLAEAGRALEQRYSIVSTFRRCLGGQGQMLAQVWRPGCWLVDHIPMIAQRGVVFKFDHAALCFWSLIMAMENIEDLELEDSAGQVGMKWLGRVLAIVTILVVAAFGDVMYIQLMTSKFPTGPLLIVCYIGAFTSFLAVVYMLIGKSILFTPGRQMTLAWLIFAIELALIALNIVLVFQADGAGSTGFLAAWLQAAPATPVINMAGVAILFFLDEDGKMKHEDMELAWDMKRANRKHFKAMARARLRLQTKQLNFLVTELDRAVAAPESMQAIQRTAIDLNTHLLGQLSGGRTYRAPTALPALAPASLPATAPAPALNGPTGPVVPSEKPGWRPRLPRFLGKQENTAPIVVPASAPSERTSKQRRQPAAAGSGSSSVAAARRARRVARMRPAVAAVPAPKPAQPAAAPTPEPAAPAPAPEKKAGKPRAKK